MGSIEAAIDDLRSQKAPNIKQTALKHGVNRSTLSRRWNGKTMSKQDGYDTQSLLNKQQQRLLVDEINRLSARGTPPTVQMVRVFAFNMGGTWPGINWASRFISCYDRELKSVYLKGFDVSRKKADSFKELKAYFELVFDFSYIFYF
jgi:hypothetical protein